MKRRNAVEWTILESDKTKQDPTGVEGFILRMDKELRSSGPPLEGFRFLNSGLEMLRITRDIEAEAQASGVGSTLYVGFQTAEKLAKEMKRYRQINQSGVQIVGFGQGDIPEEDTPALEQWVDLPQNTRALENQWYLVATLPTPIVFIGWEVSIPQMFGQGGSADRVNSSRDSFLVTKGWWMQWSHIWRRYAASTAQPKPCL
jgi:hypothetical protein